MKNEDAAEETKNKKLFDLLEGNRLNISISVFVSVIVGLSFPIFAVFFNDILFELTKLQTNLKLSLDTSDNVDLIFYYGLSLVLLGVLIFICVLI